MLSKNILEIIKWYVTTSSNGSCYGMMNCVKTSLSEKYIIIALDMMG